MLSLAILDLSTVTGIDCNASHRKSVIVLVPLPVHCSNEDKKVYTLNNSRQKARRVGIGGYSAVTEPSNLKHKNPHNPNVDSPRHNFIYKYVTCILRLHFRSALCYGRVFHFLTRG